MRGPRKDSQLIIRCVTTNIYVMTQNHARARSRFGLRSYHPAIMGKKNLNPADAYRKYFKSFGYRAHTYIATRKARPNEKRSSKRHLLSSSSFVTRSDHGFLQ